MLNKVMLIGNLGADPEIRYMPNGDPIATIRLATTRRWRDRNTNERKEATEWHRVVFFSGLAKTVGEYLKRQSNLCRRPPSYAKMARPGWPGQVHYRNRCRKYEYAWQS